MFVNHKKMDKILKEKKKTSINHCQKGRAWGKKLFTLNSCLLMSLISCSCTVTTHLDPLLLQAQAQHVGCHYSHSHLNEKRDQISSYLFSPSQKKKKSVVCLTQETK